MQVLRPDGAGLLPWIRVMSWGFAAQHLRDETSENIVMKTLMMKRRLQLADVCCHYSLCWAEIIQTFALK